METTRSSSLAQKTRSQPVECTGTVRVSEANAVKESGVSGLYRLIQAPALQERNASTLDEARILATDLSDTGVEFSAEVSQVNTALLNSLPGGFLRWGIFAVMSLKA